MKTKILIVRLTEEQDKLLDEKTHDAGFLKKSDYVRSVLFMQNSTSEMIKKIHDKMMKDGN